MYRRLFVVVLAQAMFGKQIEEKQRLTTGCYVVDNFFNVGPRSLFVYGC